MALWRIRYEDRYQRQRSFYHEACQRPSNGEAEEVVVRDLNGFYNRGSRQMASVPDTSGSDIGITVFAIDEVVP